MSIWGEVELLCRAISKEGGKEAESILTQAKAEAEKIIARTERQTEKEFREKIFTQRGKAYAKARLVVDAAELEAKKRIITLFLPRKCWAAFLTAWEDLLMEALRQ